MSLIEQYVVYFRGRTDAVCLMQKGTWKSVRTKNGAVDQHIKNHLNGLVRMAVYNVLPDGVACFGAFDFDSHGKDEIHKVRMDEISGRCQRLLNEKGIPCIRVVSSSGYGNYHVFISLSNPMDAKIVRRTLGALLIHTAGPALAKAVEVYPKQERVANGKLGSAITLPFFGGEVRHGRGVCIDAAGKTIEPDFSQVDVDVFNKLAGEYLVKQGPGYQDISIKRNGESILTLLARSDVSEGERHNSLSRIIGHLKHHKLPREEIALFAHEWNNKQPIGLPEEEVERLIQDLGGGGVCETEQAAESLLLSAREILSKEFPEPLWVIPNILPTGLALLAGRPKVGKSWLALQFLSGVAHGGLVFGEKVEQCRVLYIAAEDGPRRLKKRMQTQQWSDMAMADFMPLREFRQSIGTLNESGCQKLSGLIRERAYRLVVIDTLSRTIRGDQNKVEEMTESLSRLHAIANNQSISIVVIDHHKKNKSETADPVDDVLGSTGKAAVGDLLMGLYRERGKGDAVLAVSGRDIEDMALVLRMNWRIGTWEKTGKGTQSGLSVGQQNVLQFLEQVQRASLKEVCEGLGKDFEKAKGTIFRDLEELLGKGRVSKQGKLYSLCDPLTHAVYTDNNTTGATMTTMQPKEEALG